MSAHRLLAVTAIAALLPGCFDFAEDRVLCQALGKCLPTQTGPDASEDGGLDGGPGSDGGTPALTGLVCLKDGWCWEHPYPQGDRLRRVWSDGGELWAVGDRGTILHFDGAAWTRATDIEDVLLSGVWSDGEGTWVVGEGIANDEPAIYSLAGGTWVQKKPPAGVSGHLTDLWASGGHWFAVGGSGSSALLLEKPAGGTDWIDSSPVPDGGDSRLASVHGASASDVWAVGEGGQALHRSDSGLWTPERIPTEDGGASYLGVHAFSSGDVWAAGSFGHVARLGDAGWSLALYPEAEEIVDVDGASPGDVRLATSYAGIWECTPECDAGYFTRTHTFDLFRVDERLSYAVGSAGMILSKIDGGGWRPLYDPNVAELRGLDVSVDGRAYAVGEDRSVLERTAAGWKEIHTELGSADDFRAVYLDGPGSGWVAARGLLQRLNAGAQPPVTQWKDGGVNDLYAIHGRGQQPVVAVGDGGVVLWKDGPAWRTVQAADPISPGLLGVWVSEGGNAFIVGTAGTLLVADGGSPVARPISTNAGGRDLSAVWGRSESDLWVAARDGSVFHFDGTGWSEPETAASATSLRSMWGSASGDLWVAGEGAARRFPDGRWEDLPISSRNFNFVTGDQSRVWLTGPEGAIFTYPIP